MDSIYREWERLAGSIVGSVGVCVEHFESRRRLDFNAGRRFPMASVFKLPVALHVLSLVDQGRLSFEQRVEVRRNELSPGSGTIRTSPSHPGMVLSVAELIELSLTISDNTASDVLLRLAGGPPAVTRFLRSIGSDDVRVDRSAKGLMADKNGIAGLQPDEGWSLERYQQLLAQRRPEDARAAAARFAEDDRDTMTPAAIVDLLRRILDSELLSRSSREVLLETMGRCRTGEGALKGMLPPGTGVAHKSGTLVGVVANDVGVITLPADGGRLVMAVCVKSPEASRDPSSLCQRVIAHAGRAAYDYFLFNATSVAVSS